MGRTRGREAPSGPLLPGAGRASLRGRGRASASCPRPGPGAARARCQGHPRAKGLGHGGLHDLQPGGGRAEGQRPPRLAGFHRGEGSGRSGAGVGRAGAEAGPGRLGSWLRSLPGKRRREERPSQPAAAVLPCPALRRDWQPCAHVWCAAPPLPLLLLVTNLPCVVAVPSFPALLSPVLLGSPRVSTAVTLLLGGAGCAS